MNIEEDMSSEDYLAGETISKVAESLRDRKSRMERNRAIRKCKMHFNEDVKEIDLKDMTMEQKLERQKMKNREAAQKSR